MEQPKVTVEADDKDRVINELKLKLIRTEIAYLIEHSKVCQTQYEKLCEEENKMSSLV